MYDLPEDWNVSKYWPMKYKDVYYNIRANEKYGFNNEFFYVKSGSENKIVKGLIFFFFVKPYFE